MFRRWSFLTLLTAMIALPGCGGGDDAPANRPKPVPVSGTVLYNQKPVAGATVVFHPDGHAHAASGQTDDGGRYSLQTFAPNDGAVPGEYKVTVAKIEAPPGGEERESQIDSPAPPKQQSLVPERYASPASSDLKASVTQGGDNKFDFDLKD
jgi:hypothetical protein